MRHLKSFESAYRNISEDTSSDLEIKKEKDEILKKVLDALDADMSNEPGFQSFKEELLAFLDEFPKE